MKKHQTPEVHIGDYVRLRKNPTRPSRFDGLEWEVVKSAGDAFTLRLVGGTQTCGAFSEAIESVYRPANA